MASAITLRPIHAEDDAFLRRVYAGTRAAELAATGWDDAQQQAFLRMQFDAQHGYYQQEFADASYDVIEADGAAIGRLYVDRRADEIRIIDIALVPERRGAGIGGGLMRDLLAEVQRAGKPVRIHVERNNPALHLYERLAFVRTGDTGVYYLMEWTPT